MTEEDFIIHRSDPVLITGSNGFIGSRVVSALLERGFTNLHCLVRPSSDLSSLDKIIGSFENADVQIIKGNLQSSDDCKRITRDVCIIYHLAAGRGEKSYPDAFANSVVTTRNLLDANLQNRRLKRFLNVSSFAAYSNWNIPRGGLLDETCEIEPQPEMRSAYCYAKVKQDEMVVEYGNKHKIPYVIVRPGAVYGPGNRGLTGRVGIGTFGIFLHLGGSNKIPLTYVENCADAIVLAGIKKSVDKEVFNVVDDDLPTSRQFLKAYKKNARLFRSIYLPKSISYFFCFLWEKYCIWSNGHLPIQAFNRKRWSADWKGNTYSNKKIKTLLGWRQKISFKDAAGKYFEYERMAGKK